MRYRLMATYRGAPYEAGIGPADGGVVLFAACPPPEELGFEPATGHWRKELTMSDVQAMWESRPVGTFHGDRCIVLDDLGDRLHIGYLGHDAYRAEQLGYWQVDRGVFELIAPRDEVCDIVEERIDYPRRAGAGQQASYHAPPFEAEQDYGAPGGPDAGSYPGPGGPGGPGQVPPADGGVTVPPAAAGPPLPLEAEALRAASRRDAPATGPVTGPLPAAGPAPGTGPLPAAAPSPVTAPLPAAGPGPLPTAAPGPVTGPLPAAPFRGAPDPARPAAAVPNGLAGPQAPASPQGPAGPQAPASPQDPVSPHIPASPPGLAGPQGPAAAPVTAGSPVPPAVTADAPRRRRSADRRMATERIFGELASLAAIPAASYSVGEEVDGAMCLLETMDGFEVFSSAGGSRHEVRVFSDEESACFYLFGVLAADAVRTGVLVPGAGRASAAVPGGHHPVLRR